MFKFIWRYLIELLMLHFQETIWLTDSWSSSILVRWYQVWDSTVFKFYFLFLFLFCISCNLFIILNPHSIHKSKLYPYSHNLGSFSFCNLKRIWKYVLIIWIHLTWENYQLYFLYKKIQTKNKLPLILGSCNHIIITKSSWESNSSYFYWKTINDSCKL